MIDRDPGDETQWAPNARNILLTIDAPDGRQAYVERYGGGYVIGGDMTAEEALVTLATAPREERPSLDADWYAQS